jgi:hypothetical protein
MKVESIGKLFALGAMMGLVAIAPVRADDDEETPLSEQMEDVSGALKGLRRAPDFAAKAELARKGQEAILGTLKYLPKMFEGMDAKTKARSVADYKRMIGLTYSLFAELELAFLAEDEDKADEIVDKLKDLKKEGHEAYVEDE